MPLGPRMCFAGRRRAFLGFELPLEVSALRGERRMVSLLVVVAVVAGVTVPPRLRLPRDVEVVFSAKSPSSRLEGVLESSASLSEAGSGLTMLLGISVVCAKTRSERRGVKTPLIEEVVSTTRAVSRETRDVLIVVSFDCFSNNQGLSISRVCQCAAQAHCPKRMSLRNRR